MTITFTVQGDPKPQPRPRAFARNLGGGKFAARVYDAGTAEGWKSCVALAAKPYLPTTPLAGALVCEIDFWFKRPKGHLNSKGKEKPTAPKFHASKPDADNCIKAVTDALTQIGMWGDDSQIVRLVATKRYAGPEDQTGAKISILTCEPTTAPT